MKKRIGTLLVAGIMACSMAAGLAMSGCTVKAKPEFVMPAGGFDFDSPVEITFYHTMGKALRATLDSQITEFNKLYPNITVKHEQAGSYDDVKTRVQTEIQAGTQPNISYCYPDHVALYNTANAVLSLNDFLSGGAFADMKVKQQKVDESGYIVYDENENPVIEEVSLNMSKAQESMFIEGFWEEGYKFGDESKMYTLPFAKSTEVMYYNKTFFEAHDLTPPTTWKEMEVVCDKILKITAEENKGKSAEERVYVTPFGYDSESNWFITMCEQYGSGYTSATGKKYLFNNKTNRDFVEMLNGWFQKGYFTTQAIYGGANGNKYTSGLFTNTGVGPDNQRSYMCIGSSAGANNQIAPKTNNDYDFEVGIVPIPQVYSTDENHSEYKAGYNPKVISQGPSVCIFKNEDPQKVLASWLFVKYLTTSIEFQAEFSSDSGYVPALKMDYMKEYEPYANFLKKADGFGYLTALSADICLKQSDYYYTSPAFMGSSKAREEVGLLLQAVFMGKKVEDAFKDAIEECEYFG